MKKAEGIFITGTDTGVGKTHVAAAIARELLNRAVNVGVMKPVETGCRIRSGSLVPSDALRLMKVARVHDRLDLVNPCRFSKPLAPWVAAGIEGKPISPGKIIRAFGTLSRRHEFMLVEGAGGIMVPLQDNYFYLDLAADLGLPVLIVARPNLGTINHTLLTIAALERRKQAVVGVVLNYAKSGKAGMAEQTSPAVIQKLGRVRILGVVAHGSNDAGNIVDKISPLFEQRGI